MKRTIAAVLAGSLVAVAASALTAPVGHADPIRIPVPVPADPIAPVTAAEKSAVDYWTRNNFSNMRAAKDITALQRSKPAAAAKKPTIHRTADTGKDDDAVTGKQRVIKAAAASSTTATKTGGKWTRGGKVVKTTGKVFFVVPKGRPGAGNYACSASVAPANNKAVVITAGHCINDADRKTPGKYVTHWVFVPGFKGTAKNPAPYGEYPAVRLRASVHWVKAANFNYDVGMAIVGGQVNGPHKGALVANAQGSQGLGFNLGRHKRVVNFGYPQLSPYNGKVLDYSAGNAINADANGSRKGNSSATDDPNGSHDQVVKSNLTAGASGGPWFYNFNAGKGTGTQISVNSFSYTVSAAQRSTYKIPKYNMWGPYFGSKIEHLFDVVQGAKPKATARSASTTENKKIKIKLSGTKTPAPKGVPKDPTALTFKIKKGPAHGKVTRSGSTATYTPNKNFHGKDKFTFTVGNGISTSSAAGVTVTVKS